MTEQEKKDVIRLVKGIFCDDCPFQYERDYCIHEFETWHDESELYCNKLAEKLDQELEVTE